MSMTSIGTSHQRLLRQKNDSSWLATLRFCAAFRNSLITMTPGGSVIGRRKIISWLRLPGGRNAKSRSHRPGFARRVFPAAWGQRVPPNLGFRNLRPRLLRMFHYVIGDKVAGDLVPSGPEMCLVKV